MQLEGKGNVLFDIYGRRKDPLESRGEGDVIALSGCGTCQGLDKKVCGIRSSGST